MTKTKKVVRTIVVAGVLCSLAAIATFSAFSSQTVNPDNEVTAGTVDLTDNDSDTALYSMANAKPGDSTVKCIKVSYSGSLPADVKLYTPDTVGPLGQYVDLKVEAGTGDAVNCGDFVADAGAPLFNQKLNTFPTTYAGGVLDHPGSTSSWVNGNSVTYRVTATLPSGVAAAAEGLTTGSHDLVWEAQNQ